MVSFVSFVKTFVRLRVKRVFSFSIEKFGIKDSGNTSGSKQQPNISLLFRHSALYLHNSHTIIVDSCLIKESKMPYRSN